MTANEHATEYRSFNKVSFEQRVPVWYDVVLRHACTRYTKMMYYKYNTITTEICTRMQNIIFVYI
jgi:hypothetical protein